MMTAMTTFSLMSAAIYGAVALALALVSIMCITSAQNTVAVKAKTTVKRARTMRD